MEFDSIMHEGRSDAIVKIRPTLETGMFVITQESLYRGIVQRLLLSGVPLEKAHAIKEGDKAALAEYLRPSSNEQATFYARHLVGNSQHSGLGNIDTRQTLAKDRIYVTRKIIEVAPYVFPQAEDAETAQAA